MIRKPAVAGMFYPGQKDVLQQQINLFLKNARISEDLKPKAIAVPHAGYVYSGQIAALGYKALAGVSNIKNIILIGPSHFAGFEGCALSPAEKWETSLGFCEVNNSYFSSGYMKENEKAFIREHCLEVQLPFLQTVLPNCRIVPVLTCSTDDKILAKELDAKISGSDIIVISTDLSHYYPYEEAVELDSVANKAVPRLDIASVESYSEACGKTGLLAAMRLAKIRKWKGKFLGYANSGDVTGDKESVVGYGCYAFC